MQAKNTFVDLRNEVRDLKRMFLDIQDGFGAALLRPIRVYTIEGGVGACA